MRRADIALGELPLHEPAAGCVLAPVDVGQSQASEHLTPAQLGPRLVPGGDDYAAAAADAQAAIADRVRGRAAATVDVVAAAVAAAVGLSLRARSAQ
jgi:hypothetical protein